MKPTNDHLLEFSNHVKKWAERLGMQDWDLMVTWCPDKEIGEDSAACYPDVDARHAKITLNREPDKYAVEDLDKLALHEVLHLVLADLAEFVIDYAPKSATKDADTKEHVIIQRLTNLIISYERYPINNRKSHKRKG